MKILFLDESGDSNLRAIDPYYPLFVLGGVIVDYKDLEYNADKIRDFKIKYFGTDKVILHTKEITRREGAFHILNKKITMNDFYKDLNTLMTELKYKCIACIVDKKKHIEKYKDLALDVYEYSLHILIERFIYQIKNKEIGMIKAEARGKIDDKQIQLAYERIQNKGTFFVKAEEIKQKIDSFKIHKKNENLNGLQIADLIITPIGRNHLGKSCKKDFSIIKEKLLRNKGNSEGRGIIIVPK